MPERPTTIDPQAPLTSLAERYGMTVDTIEDILRGTNEEYRKSPPLPTGATSSVELPPIALAEEAAQTAEPIANPPHISTASNRSRPLSGGFMIALYTVLLIVIGIAFSFRRGCFERRSELTATKPVDTIQNLLNQQAQKATTPPVTPSDVPPDEVPPEALSVPRETPAEPKAQLEKHASRPAHRAKENREPRAAKPSLETSSSYEAEEQLAELRANGESKAHISKVTKNGVTKYRLFTK